MRVVRVVTVVTLLKVVTVMTVNTVVTKKQCHKNFFHQKKNVLNQKKKSQKNFITQTKKISPKLYFTKKLLSSKSCVLSNYSQKHFFFYKTLRNFVDKKTFFCKKRKRRKKYVFLGYPPWILKRGGLERCGQIVISSNGKLRGKHIFQQKKCIKKNV